MGRTAGNEAREVVMTTAERLRREGKREGLREGERSGRAKILQALLERRFGPLDQATAQRLASARVRDLDRWATRILTARSLDEVFANE